MIMSFRRDRLHLDYVSADDISVRLASHPDHKHSLFIESLFDQKRIKNIRRVLESIEERGSIYSFDASPEVSLDRRRPCQEVPFRDSFLIVRDR